MTGNEIQPIKTFENPIHISLLVLWACGVATLAVSSYMLPSKYTGLAYSVGVEGGGVITFLLLIISLLISTSVWSFLTFKYRVVEYTEKFDRELEQEKLRSLHAAKLSALGRMSAGVAHEINNPLAVIALITDVMQKQQNRHNLNDEELKTGLSDIAKQVTRISTIIKTLRSMTGDGSREVMERISIAELIQQAYVSLSVRLKNENVDFFFPDSDKEILIHGRPTEVSQIIFNLISNSIDALEGKNNKWIRISLEVKNNFCVLKFADSGGPLDSDLVEKLMEPFFTTKDVGKGTGLGLSICRSIAIGHGGSLEYDSTAPTTTFILKLPLEDQGTV